jgi:hypothetical protein
MDSERYVNPKSRRDLFDQLKADQLRVYETRRGIIGEMVSLATTAVNKEIIEKSNVSLGELNDQAQSDMDSMVMDLNKDMANTNEDAEIAFLDLKDFV